MPRIKKTVRKPKKAVVPRRELALKALPFDELIRKGSTNKMACRIVATMFRDQHVPCMEWFKRAATLGCVDSMKDCWRFHLCGTTGFPQDGQKALVYAVLAATQGSASMCEMLGKSFAHYNLDDWTLTVNKNIELAKTFLRMGEKHDEPPWSLFCSSLLAKLAVNDDDTALARGVMAAVRGDDDMCVSLYRTYDHQLGALNLTTARDPALAETFLQMLPGGAGR